MDAHKLPSIHIVLEGISAERDDTDIRSHQGPSMISGAFEQQRYAAYQERNNAQSTVNPLLSSHATRSLPGSTRLPQPVEPLSFDLSRRNMHSRSFSDNTHPYPTLRNHVLYPVTHHRRSVSANIDTRLTGSAVASPLSLTLTASSTSQASPSTVPGKSSSDSLPNVDKSKSDLKYTCTYCDKGFSRPSSLRIHTYSHTGERPFVCPKDGCSRKFNVQSNMRRHLQVHQLDRQRKRKTRKPSVSDHWINVNQPQPFSAKS